MLMLMLQDDQVHISQVWHFGQHWKARCSLHSPAQYRWDLQTNPSIFPSFLLIVIFGLHKKCRTMWKSGASTGLCILPANIGYCQRNDPLNGITFFAVNEKIYISILTFFLFPFSSHLHFQDGMLIHNVDLTLRGAAARGALTFFRLTRDDNGIA